MARRSTWLLGAAVLLGIAVLLRARLHLPDIPAEPRTDAREPRSGRAPSGTPGACVRLVSARGGGVGGLDIWSDSADAVVGTTDPGGMFCLLADQLPANVGPFGWPGFPESVRLSAGDRDREIVVSQPCSATFGFSRAEGLASETITLHFSAAGWEKDVPVAGDVAGPFDVPAGALGVRASVPEDGSVTVTPAIVTCSSGQVALRIERKPVVSVRVVDEAGGAVVGARVGGSVTDASGRAETPVFGGICLEVVAAGYVGGMLCPVEGRWAGEEVEFVMARATSVSVWCQENGATPIACKAPHIASCVGADTEGTCSTKGPFLCDCPIEPGVRVIGGGRNLFGTEGTVVDGTAVLSAGTASVELVGPDVDSLGAEACPAAAWFLLDRVGSWGPRLAPKAPSCDTGGRVRWTGLVAGTWLLTANDGPWSRVGPFELAEGEVREIALTAPSGPPRRVTLTARHSDGTPAPGVSVQAREVGLSGQAEITDGAGRAIIDVHPTTLEIVGGDADGRGCRIPIGAVRDSVDCRLSWDEIWTDWDY